MNKKYENKVPWVIDLKFIEEHVDEIIDNIKLEAKKGILLPPFMLEGLVTPYLQKKYYDVFTETGTNGFFHHSIANPGETEVEAHDRMIKAFCDDTGLWGIYEWVTPEERERRVKE